jgi:hypothetical protein
MDLTNPIDLTNPADSVVPLMAINFEAPIGNFPAASIEIDGGSQMNSSGITEGAVNEHRIFVDARRVSA